MAETLPDLILTFKNYIVIDLQTWSLGIVLIILIKSFKCMSLAIVTVSLLGLDITFSAFFKTDTWVALWQSINIFTDMRNMLVTNIYFEVISAEISIVASLKVIFALVLVAS